MKLKESNKKAIKDFFKNGDYSIIQGSKLFALLRIFEKQGEDLNTDDLSLQGAKAIQIDGLYYAIKKNTFKNGAFRLKLLILK